MEEDRDLDMSMVTFLHAWGKRKKEQHPEDDLRVWTKGRGGGRKEPRFINGDVPRCMRNKEETPKFRSKNEGRGQQWQSKKGRQ